MLRIKMFHNGFVHAMTFPDGLYVPTVIVVGATNTGKSTLINSVLGLATAPTRAGGAPCTLHFKEYGPTATTHIQLVDTRGLELVTSQTQLATLIKYVEKRCLSSNWQSAIDAVWFLPDERWFANDAAAVRELRACNLPVVVIVTKCDSAARCEIDNVTGLAAVEGTVRAVQEDLPGVPVFRVGDPSRVGGDPQPPLQCPRGHDRSEFVENRRQRMWRCVFEEDDGEECGCRGDFKLPAPFGITELVEATRRACDAMQVRKRAMSCHQALPRIRQRVRALLAIAFWRGMTAAGIDEANVTTELGLAAEIRMMYGEDVAEEESMDQEIVQAIKSSLLRAGRNMISTESISALKGTWVGRRVAGISEGVLGGVALQVFGMGVVMAVEKVRYMGVRDRFEDVVMRECVKRDLNEMNHERKKLDAEMQEISLQLAGGIGEFGVAVEHAYQSDDYQTNLGKATES